MSRSRDVGETSKRDELDELAREAGIEGGQGRGGRAVLESALAVGLSLAALVLLGILLYVRSLFAV